MLYHLPIHSRCPSPQYNQSTTRPNSHASSHPDHTSHKKLPVRFMAPTSPQLLRSRARKTRAQPSFGLETSSATSSPSNPASHSMTRKSPAPPTPSHHPLSLPPSSPQRATHAQIAFLANDDECTISQQPSIRQRSILLWPEITYLLLVSLASLAWAPTS